MKRIGLAVGMGALVVVMLNWPGTVQAQSTRYVRSSQRAIASPYVLPPRPRSLGVNYSRRHGDPVVVESGEILKGDDCGCNRCCPPIIPTLLNGIGNALDLLLPCRSCAPKSSCGDCGKSTVIPTRTYRAGCCSLLPSLPLVSVRFHHGGHCGCYGHELHEGVPVGEPVPTKAPEEVIPTPEAEKDGAPRSARRFQTREEALRGYRPGNRTLQLAPPRAATSGNLKRYGQVTNQPRIVAQPVVRTGYTSDVTTPRRERAVNSSTNPLR